MYQDETPGQDIYPIPVYNSILNWAYLDGEQSFFHKSNIENSVFPSAVIRRPKEFTSNDEASEFKEELNSKTGASNGGRLLVLSGNGMDDVPEFEQIQANSNDKLFEGTAKELKENICFAHKINPSIMGIKVAGSLGNAEELTTSYAIFEKNVVMPDRTTMSEIFNDLLDITGLNQTVTINNFQIVGEVMIELPEDIKKLNKTIEALNPVIQAKILENMTQNEIRNLASLKPIITKETNADGTQVEVKAENETNDALKGLSAQENMDMMRIIRDHGKGKLNDVLAIARLTSYGLSNDQAKEILGIE
jgi:capsid portal protein